MAKTRHLNARCSQRGISEGMLELVRSYGVWEGDKLVLNRNSAELIAAHCAQLQKLAQRVEKRGGLVLVEADGSEITTYSLDSYKRSKSKRNH